MTLQSLMDQWESVGGWDSILADMGQREWDNTTGDEGSNWTEGWVFRVLLAPHRVRASYHEEEALRRFEQAQREGTR